MMHSNTPGLGELTVARHRVTAALSRPALVVILGWFGFGSSLLLGALLGYETNPALTPAPVWQKITLGLLLTVGSALISAAALHWRRASTSWQLELLALPILTAGWILYAVSLALGDTDPFTDWPLSPVMLGLSFIAATLVRLYEVLFVVRRTRRNVDALPEELRP